MQSTLNVSLSVATCTSKLLFQRVHKNCSYFTVTRTHIQNPYYCELDWIHANSCLLKPEHGYPDSYSYQWKPGLRQREVQATDRHAAGRPPRLESRDQYWETLHHYLCQHHSTINHIQAAEWLTHQTALQNCLYRLLMSRLLSFKRPLCVCACVSVCP